MDPDHQSDKLLSEPPTYTQQPTEAVGSPVSHDDGSSVDGSFTKSAAPVAATPDPFAEGVQSVVGSEIGVQTLLNRLKQSIASAKEFALFLKKRSMLEEEHASGLRKMCKLTHDNLRRAEHRQGSFATSYDEVTRIHDQMAENGTKFASSLHQMHEDLLEMATNVERGRKHWKQTGLAAEQRVQDTEAAMRKSKYKYDAIAEDYDRARTGDRQTGKIFGIKGPKSAAQHEDDLHKKVIASDADYSQKVQSAQSSRSELLSRGRPEAVRNLMELIRECDSALTLQMQKFASFNEKLLLHNGLAISPMKDPMKDGQRSGRSLRDAIASIDNDRDLNYFVASQASKVPPKAPEIRYERNAVLNPPMQSAQTSQAQRQSEPLQSFNSRTPNLQANPVQQFQSVNTPTGPGTSGINSTPQTPNGQQPQSHNNNMMGASSAGLEQGSMPLAQRPLDNRNFSQGPPPGMQPHERSVSMGQHSQPPSQYSSMRQRGQGNHTYNSGSIGSSGPPQLSSLPFQTSTIQTSSFNQGQNFSTQPPGHQGMSASAAISAGSLPPLKPVFGMTLEQLFDRDGSAVPMVVYQCIQAVDLFGLEVEGIYRLSGTSSHVNKIKAMFDNDASKVDFRNPENFFHDVNSVAGLLKQFFRDLPDPLLTAEHYQAFIDAAKSDDDIVRRDSLHAIINGLPDPNYATLRALTLHLHRVQDNSASNRMNASNLAIVFGPTLMGANTGPNIQDAGWQVRVIDTILNNTLQIFDDDD